MLPAVKCAVSLEIAQGCDESCYGSLRDPGVRGRCWLPRVLCCWLGGDEAWLCEQGLWRAGGHRTSSPAPLPPGLPRAARLGHV